MGHNRQMQTWSWMRFKFGKTVIKHILETIGECKYGLLLDKMKCVEMEKWRSSIRKGGKRQAIKQNNGMCHMISFYGKKGNTNKEIQIKSWKDKYLP